MTALAHPVPADVSLPKPQHWLVLGALVLAAHAALLSGELAFFAPEPNASLGSFQTRRVAAAPVNSPAVFRPTPAAKAAQQAPANSAAAKRAAVKPAAQAAPQHSAAAHNAAAQTDTQPDRSEPTPGSAASSGLEPNQPLAGENTAQAAINNVASSTPNEMSSQAATTGLQASAEPAPDPNAAPAYVLGPVAVPAPQNLRYNASGLRKGQNYTASGDLYWAHDGQSYELRVAASILLWGREWASKGQLASWGLQPQRFSDKSGNRAMAAHFNREQTQISFSNNQPSAALTSGAQDRASAIMQLASLLAGAADKYPSGSRIAVQVASAREASPWVFVVEGDEQVNTDSGAKRATKVSRAPRAGREFDDRLELWLAPDLGYLPARIKLTYANADYFDLVLR